MKLAVLIAEGDPFVRDKLCQALEAAGHTATIVEDTQTALSRFGESAFDVVVSDVSTSRVDGLTLLHSVKQQTASTAVILIGSHDNCSAAEAALKADVDDHVIKPVDIQDLVLRIERVGERRRIDSELRAARARPLAVGAGSKLIGDCPAMRSLIQRLENHCAHAGQRDDRG